MLAELPLFKLLQVTFEGGSGYISFDENGDRPGFSGSYHVHGYAVI